eukprot:gnl/MRDRNA2_/MRDRNA2_80377_c0_seq1.p1 gnl/MRDRNA2_/MRDRNA2_80377_c0~~gnl/MRDRNA2_/MRDRNA2_80377_c0_seq1.p1  ORF type:complete len:278 (-),score=51.33 gnl/MRDRNA2_/MRDRNA2_80377_c0_seq1:28-861(-)
MIDGICNSIRSLVWCCVILALVQFIFSVALVEALAADLQEAREQSGCDSSGCPDDTEPPVVLQQYGSVTQVMYGLFKAISSGQDWGELADTLGDIHWLLVILLCLYIAFASFTVLNIVTSIFVENASAFAQRDQEEMVLHDVQNRKKLIEDLKKIFESADNDGSMTLDFEEYCRLFDKPVMQAYFRKLDLDVKDRAEDMFDLMDFEGKGIITIDSFVMCITHLRGAAKSLDMAKLRLDIVRILERLSVLLETFNTLLYKEFDTCDSTLTTRNSTGSR